MTSGILPTFLPLFAFGVHSRVRDRVRGQVEPEAGPMDGIRFGLQIFHWISIPSLT